MVALQGMHNNHFSSPEQEQHEEARKGRGEGTQTYAIGKGVYCEQ